MAKDISLDEFKKRATQSLGNATELMEGKPRPHTEWWDELRELLDQESENWHDHDEVS